MKGIIGTVEWEAFGTYGQVCDFLNNPHQTGATLVAIVADGENTRLIVFYVPHNPKEGCIMGYDE